MNKRKTTEDYNDGKINLYNTTKNKLGRTKDYIKSLEPLFKWLDKEDGFFNAIKNEAMQLKEPNEALERIRFNPLGRDGIYYEAERLSKERKHG